MQLTNPSIRNAFTIVEIVMVVVLTGVMAAFVFPNFRKSVDKANERAAASNLMIIYAAQQIKSNNGSSFVAGADTAAVNTNLSLGIMGNGITYACTLPTAITFTCTAVGTTFTMRATSANSNLCCQSGTCYTKPAC